MLNLYSMAISPFAAKVHYFLEESGIPYKYNHLNAFEEAGRKLLNQQSPLWKMPAIELNGFHLGESNAILRYLAARYELPSYYPLNLEDRANVDMLMDFSMLHLNRWLTMLAYNLVLAPKWGRPVDPKAIDDARANLPEMLTRFDRHITGRKFLAGPNLTLADCNLLPFLANHQRIQVCLRDFPAIQSWVDHMVARPAWKRVDAVVAKAMQS